MCDLYRIGFNPILAAPEFAPTAPLQPASDDIAVAQNKIRATDVLAVIYPIWAPRKTGDLTLPGSIVA